MKWLILLFLANYVYGMIDIEWNKHVINLIEKEGLTPPIVSRSLSILYKSMLESYLEVAKITNNELYREYAVNGAAHEVMVSLFKDYNFSMNFTGNRYIFSYYNRIGKRRAKIILKNREGDYKLLNSTEYDNKKENGRWYSNKTSPLLPKFGNLEPMVITSISKYLMPAPPKMNSLYFKKSYNETFKVGRKDSMFRTNDQSESAKFWEAGKGTCTPPGVWNLIAQDIVKNEESLLERLYVFSVLNDALFDTAIVVWYNKYKYNTWRPDMAFDSWEPLLKTPPFPEYGSGHSAFSGAGSEILTKFFGRKSFKLQIKNITRSFNSFNDAAYEAGRSRIYGGIHFEFSNIPFINLGRRIAREVVRKLKKS